MKRSASFDVLLSCFLVLLKKLMYCCVLKKGNWLVFDVLRSDLLSKFLYLIKTSYVTFDIAKVGRNSVAEKKTHAFLFVLLRQAAIFATKRAKGCKICRKDIKTTILTILRNTRMRMESPTPSSSFVFILSGIKNLSLWFRPVLVEIITEILLGYHPSVI